MIHYLETFRLGCPRIPRS